MNHPLNEPPSIVRIKHVSALVGEHLPVARFSINRVEATPLNKPDPGLEQVAKTNGFSLHAEVSCEGHHMLSTKDEMIAFCRKILASYKCPRKVQFFSDVPKTCTGKIMRR
jgi:acyl-CoA synthetase (AMP-forming)/AMP-acid ligase II